MPIESRSMDDLYTRSYLVTHQKGYRPTKPAPVVASPTTATTTTTSSHRRRRSFGRRSTSVPPKDRKKFEARLEAHDQFQTGSPVHIAELDGTALAIDTHKVIMTAELESALPRNISRKIKKISSPTTPRSPEIKISDHRQGLPKDFEPTRLDEGHTLYRKNSSGELRPPSRSQPVSSSSSSTRSRKMSTETYVSSASTVTPNYVHEPDSPTIPAFATMPNPKVIASIPRGALGLVTQGLPSGTGLPAYSGERSAGGASTGSLSRRRSSTRVSGGLAPSPNPFLMRDLPDSLRDLVLDQGLSATLKGGATIDMTADEVQAAKQILNAWNIYEGNLGGGISHEKAYLCMLYSKLPKQKLAEIWDNCQTIVDPPMPLRTNHSLFPEEFILAIQMIQRELKLDMDSLVHNLTIKSPLMSQRRSSKTTFLINGKAVVCPNNPTDILLILGIPDNVIPPQVGLDKGLYIAAAKGHRTAVQWFLEQRADVDALNTFANRRALHAACEAGHEDIVRMLLQYNASVNARDEDGRTPLHFAASDGNDAIVRMLIQAGGDVTAPDDEGDLPLHFAAEYGCRHVIPLLSRSRVKVDTPGSGRRSALMRAVAGGHKATVRCLLDEGASVNQKDEAGWTPLHYAVLNGNETLARMLLEDGANIYERGDDEQNPLGVAVQHDLKGLARFLVENGANINDYGANGMAPIHISAMMGKERMLTILLELGAMVNNYTKGSAVNSQTALMVAIIQQEEAIVKRLLDHPKIQLEAEDRNGSTALHYAVQKGNLSIIRMLLEKNIRVDDTNMDGKTPLDLAKDKEIRDMLKLASKSAKLPRKFSIGT